MDNQNAKKPREYIAFISYRHKSLDTMLAARLHNMLKYYVIDKYLRDDPTRKRLGDVFRDRDELPLTDNLTEDIYNALDHSQFLIVICTNETPKSLWVSKEIEYFISKHGRERVLTVLAQDPPELSFPEEVTLIKDADGNVIEQVEPLAAYVAGRNRLHTLWKLRQEFPRLLAAILGKPYPQVAQQEKRYRQKRIMAALGAALVIAGGFIAMLLNRNAQINAQNQQITAQNDEILEKNAEIEAKNEEIRLQLEASQFNESQALALLSAQQLADGDRIEALKNALTALPTQDDPRPYCAEAEFALANALRAYTEEAVRFDLKITQPTDILNFALSENGSHVVTLDISGCLRCFDLTSGNMVWQHSLTTEEGQIITPTAEALRLLEIREERDEVVVADRYNTWCLQLSTGDLKSAFAYEEPGYIKLSQEGNVLVCYYPYTDNSGEEEKNGFYYQFYDPSTGEALSWRNYTYSGDWEAAQCALSPDGARAAQFFINNDLQEIEVYATDIQTGNQVYFQKISLAAEYSLSGLSYTPTVFDYAVQGVFLEDGSLVVYFTHITEDLFTSKLYANQYSPSGELLNELRMDVTLQNDIPVESVHGIHQDEECLYFIHNTYISVIQKDSLKEGYVYGIGDDYFIDLNENNFLMDHYIWNGEPVLIFRNGATTSLNLFKEYPDCDFTISKASSTVDAQGIVTAILPIPEPNCLYFQRTTEDTRGTHITPTDPHESIDLYGIYAFPSGNHFLVLESSNDYYEPREYAGTIYDVVSGAIIDQFHFSPDNYLSLCGFSADETKLLFNGYFYDLTSHTLQKMEDLDQVSSGTSITLDAETVPMASQQAGNPIITAYCDYTNNMLYWWQDGADLHSASLPQDMEMGYGSSIGRNNLEVGGNGLILWRNYVSDTAYPENYLLFSTQTQQWRSIENSASGNPAIALGVETPLVAFADQDNVIRIYDFEKDSIIRDLPVDTDCLSCHRLMFLRDDTLLLMIYNDGRHIVLDASSGTILAQFSMEQSYIGDHNDGSILTSIQVDESNSMLYLYEYQGQSMGYRIDMDTWEIVAEIPGMSCWVPGSNRIVTFRNNGADLVLFDAYSLEDLIAWGQEILGETP